MAMHLVVLKKTYPIASLAPNATVPEWANDEKFASVTTTGDDLSVVVPEDRVPSDVILDRGWRCLKLEEPLDLDVTGVLAAILCLSRRRASPCSRSLPTKPTISS